MNWILKNKNRNKKTILFVLFLLSAVLFSPFFSAKIQAADAPVTTGRGSVQNPNQLPSGSTSATSPTAGATGHTIVGAAVNNSYVAGDNGGSRSNAGTQNTTTCGIDFSCYIKLLLVGVLNFVGWLFGIAGTLFAWVVDPKNISGPDGVLQKQAVKDVWIMVRDLLNMTFILILLFAAFCTIFQIDKWNLKKVWLNILINALLVNFSYTIARFFIDISNVAFYYLANHLFSSASTVVDGSAIFAMFGGASGISEILSPAGYATYDIAYLLAMIVFVFILGMTLLIIAALFVVRLIALTMIVMFSPVGFVGYIFPATSSYADKWWTNLFSYSFFAPIMIFVMAIALRITEAIGKQNINSFKNSASANAGIGQDATWIANAAFMLIPILILWMGMGIAKKMGIEGADTVVNGVKKGGKWLANRPGALGGYAWKRSGVPGGIKKGYENAQKSGKLFGSERLGWILKNGQEGRENRIAGYIDNRSTGVADAVRKKKAEEFRKKYKEKADEHDRVDAVGASGATDRILRADLHHADSDTRNKAAMEVASLLHALKTDKGKSDAFELRITEQVIRSGIIPPTASDADRDLIIKKAIAANWKILNDKGKQAHQVATEGKTTATAINTASATAAVASGSGVVDTWTT
ncbi:MAG: hypothetical protein WCI36_04390 [bacterium]